jgi:AraC-like DNA-binding protein
MTKPRLELIPNSGSKAMIFKIDRDLWEVFHYHSEFDVLLSLKDHQGQFVSGDHSGILEHGTLIINGPYIPHSMQSGRRHNNDWAKPSMAVIHFSKEIVGGDFLSHMELKSIGCFLRAAKYGFQFYGKTRSKASKLILEMREQSQLERFTQLLLLLELFADSDEKQQLATSGYYASNQEGHIDRIENVIHYLNANMAEQIRLDDIAKVAGMGPNSFCRFFRANTGKTFVEYLNSTRITEACRLLIETDDSVTKIAFHVGFNNLSNFNRQFRNLKGLSPREYRV